MRIPVLVLVASTLIALTSLNLDAQEWTRFHGPNGQGIATSGAETIPSEFTEKDYQWQVGLPGIGHSSPVLWGKKVFLLSADPKTAERFVVCINADDGEILWQRSFPSATHHLHTRSSYASCTPAVDAERVYVAWSDPSKVTLMALTHDGKDAWSRDLGPWVSQHGFGTSPMLYKDLVVLHNSQQSSQLDPGETPGKSSVIALDRATGKDVWAAPRESSRVCYCVPCVHTNTKGEDELICYSTAEGIFAIDPADGKKKWSAGEFSMRTVASPVFASGLVFGSTGSGGGGNYSVAVKLTAKPEVAYELRGSSAKAPYVPTPVANGDLVFMFYDKGFVSCLNAKTSEVLWQERLGEAFSGSPVRVGNRIFAINEDGDVISIAATDKFKVLGRSSLGEPSRATPAIANGRMYLRTESNLICVGK